MKKTKTLLGLLGVCAFGLSVATSCSKNPTSEETSTTSLTSETGAKEVLGVVLDSEELNLVIGEEKQLVATVAPQGATTTFTWTSDDPEVATVDNTGKVCAISEGVAIITVTTANGKEASCGINVSKPLGEPLYQNTMAFLDGCDSSIVIYDETFLLSGFAVSGALSLEFSADSIEYTIEDNTFKPAPGAKIVAIGIEFQLMTNCSFKDGGYEIRFYVNNGTNDFELGTYFFTSEQAAKIGIDTNVTYEVVRATNDAGAYIALRSDGTCSIYGKFMGAVEVAAESTWDLTGGVLTVEDAVAQTAFGPFTVVTTVEARGNLNFSMDLVENESHLDTVVIPYTTAIATFPTIELSYVPVESIQVNDSIALGLAMVSGEKVDFSQYITVLPENATDTNVTLTTDIPSIVSVASDGKLEAYKAGTAQVTITSNDTDDTGAPISATASVNVTYPEKGETFSDCETFDEVRLYRGVIDFGILKVYRDYVFYPDGIAVAYQTTDETKNGYDGAIACVGYYSLDDAEKIVYKAFNEEAIAEYPVTDSGNKFSVDADGVVSTYELVECGTFSETKTFQMELDLSAYIGMPAGSYVLINELVFNPDGTVLCAQFNKGMEALKVQSTAAYSYADGKVAVFDAFGDFNFAAKDVTQGEAGLQFDIGNALLPLVYVEVIPE